MLKKVTQLFRSLFIELEDEDVELLNYRRSRLVMIDEDLEFNV
ncbi:hypothetical protein QFZ80_000213 [Paenibacillus sp. V4I7]|nr:hypothetical protein [Paenibacillus sp. V4I7]MDQ0914071.1 hypothetical protein [Paenibacillus sp. V4I5]